LNQTKKDRIIEFLWQYIWIIGILVILYLIHVYKDNNIIQMYGSRLIILFLGLFLGIKYISKVENRIIKEEEQKRFLSQIGPILIARLRFDMVQILDILFKTRILALDGEFYMTIFGEGGASSKVDCNELSEEFKKLSEMFLELEANSTEKVNIYKNLMIYFNDINVYLEDIQNNIIPLIFMHSKNATYINLFINFNGNLISLKENIGKIRKDANSDILLSFSQLFENFSNISCEIICIMDKPKDVLKNDNSPRS
jgi:hypothetical protein